MNRIISATLCAIFSLALVLPALAQSGENSAWQAIQDERDARRKAEKLDSFIKTYASSPHRPEVDIMLVDYWVSNNDFAKILTFVDGFKQSLPSADNQSKATIYNQGMLASIQLNNIGKLKEFSDMALAADPKNFQALAIMASSGVLDPKTSFDYAKRAADLPKPKTMKDAQYQSLLKRAKDLVASANASSAPAGGGGGGNAASAALNSVQGLLSEKKYKEAVDVLTQALQQFPKEGAIHYNIGLANYMLMSEAAQGAQSANDDQIKAMLANAKDDETKAAAKKEQLTEEALKRRDAALEGFGKAVAAGGSAPAESRKLLDALYQNKKGSMEGIDQFIADKKKEIGL